LSFSRVWRTSCWRGPSSRFSAPNTWWTEPHSQKPSNKLPGFLGEGKDDPWNRLSGWFEEKLIGMVSGSARSKFSKEFWWKFVVFLKQRKKDRFSEKFCRFFKNCNSRGHRNCTYKCSIWGKFLVWISS
jgi:hypothetical protein